MGEGLIIRRGGVDCFSETDPFGDGSLIDGWLFDNSFAGLKGNAAVGTNTTFAAGFEGQAVAFNGSTSRVDYPLGLVPSADSARSVTFWCYLDSAAVNKRMLLYGSGNHGTNSAAFDIEANIYQADGAGTGYWGIHWWGNGRKFSGASGVTYDAWVHIAVSHAGGPLSAATKLYINGNVVGDLSAISQPFNTSSPDVHISGYRPYIGGGLEVLGKKDNQRLFNREITAAEVKKLYNAGG